MYQHDFPSKFLKFQKYIYQMIQIHTRTISYSRSYDIIGLYMQTFPRVVHPGIHVTLKIVFTSVNANILR